VTSKEIEALKGLGEILPPETEIEKSKGAKATLVAATPGELFLCIAISLAFG